MTRKVQGGSRACTRSYDQDPYRSTGSSMVLQASVDAVRLKKMDGEEAGAPTRKGGY